MHALFSLVKAVGFDLDKTLYPDTPEINERIAQEVFKIILKFKPELETTKRVASIYRKRGEELHSWSKVLREVGVENCREVLNSCLDSADITDLIKEDKELVLIIEELHQKFWLFLITGSAQNQAIKKLAKIGIRSELFHSSSFGDDSYSLSETSAKNFQHFLSKSPYQPSEHVYIGDDPLRDVIPPKNLGMKTILVGSYSREADFSVADIHDIKYLLCGGS